MSKIWKKNQDNSFTFFNDDEQIGSIDFTFDNMNKAASFSIGSKHYSIHRKGFWSSVLLIRESNENEVAKLYAEKWFANNWVLEYESKRYQISVRNNPLAEYVITSDEKEILAYGLQANGGNIEVRIKGSNGENEFIFDFLLWYLFAPIAVENMGDNLMFSLLLAQ